MALSALCAVVLGALFVGAQFLKVTQVTVIAPLKSPPVAGAGTFVGRNMLTLSPREVAEFFVRRNPAVAGAQVTKHYPTDLEVVITTLPAAAQLSATDGFFVVASTGRILQKSTYAAADLPTITFYQRLNSNILKIGDTVPYQDIRDALRFIDSLKKIGYSPQAVDISGHNMIACTLKDGRTILLSTQKDIGVQEYQLKTILERLKIKGGDFTTLDLRFDKPVIKFR